MKFKKIFQLIINTNIQKLEGIVTLLAIILFGCWLGVSDRIFGGQAPQIYNYLVILFCAFLLGFSGFFQVVKKEMPWMGRTIKGSLAVISGYVLMISFWGVGLLGLYFVLTEI